jgi:hypothetical protein
MTNLMVVSRIASEWHQDHASWPHWMRVLYALYMYRVTPEIIGKAYWRQVART